MEIPTVSYIYIYEAENGNKTIFWTAAASTAVIAAHYGKMLNKLTPPHSYLFFIISKYLLVSETKKNTIESHKRRSCGCNTAECPKTVVEKWNDDCDECSFIHYKKEYRCRNRRRFIHRNEQRKMEIIKQHQKLIINRINNNSNENQKEEATKTVLIAQVKVIADHQWGSETHRWATHNRTPSCCNKSTKTQN